MNITTKEEARSQNSRFYFTGSPCRNKHIAERYVSTGLCVVCVQNRTTKYHTSNEGRMKQLQKEWYTKNKTKVIQKAKQWNAENKETFKENNSYSKRGSYLRRRKFGISETEFAELFNNADDKCQICKQPETTTNSKGETKALAIDHCHKTGKVRGVLCQKCNTALGGFKDSIELLENAIRYLSKQ